MIALFYIGLGAIGMAFIHAFVDDLRNRRAFGDARVEQPRAKHVDLPVATVIIRADRDVAADISRALQRPPSRWN